MTSIHGCFARCTYLIWTVHSLLVGCQRWPVEPCHLASSAAPGFEFLGWTSPAHRAQDKCCTWCLFWLVHDPCDTFPSQTALHMAHLPAALGSTVHVAPVPASPRHVAYNADPRPAGVGAVS